MSPGLRAIHALTHSSFCQGLGRTTRKRKPSGSWVQRTVHVGRPGRKGSCLQWLRWGREPCWIQASVARASRLPSGIARDKGRRQGLGCEGPPAPGSLENCPSSLNWEASCCVLCLSSALGQDEYEAGACLFCLAEHFHAGHL